jgi:hypothetical protein
VLCCALLCALLCLYRWTMYIRSIHCPFWTFLALFGRVLTVTSPEPSLKLSEWRAGEHTIVHFYRKWPLEKIKKLPEEHGTTEVKNFEIFKNLPYSPSSVEQTENKRQLPTVWKSCWLSESTSNTKYQRLHLCTSASGRLKWYKRKYGSSISVTPLVLPLESLSCIVNVPFATTVPSLSPLFLLPPSQLRVASLVMARSLPPPTSKKPDCSVPGVDTRHRLSMISEGIEPSTFSVLTKCDNRYTMKPCETHGRAWVGARAAGPRYVPHVTYSLTYHRIWLQHNIFIHPVI